MPCLQDPSCWPAAVSGADWTITASKGPVVLGCSCCSSQCLSSAGRKSAVSTEAGNRQRRIPAKTRVARPSARNRCCQPVPQCRTQGAAAGMLQSGMRHAGRPAHAPSDCMFVQHSTVWCRLQPRGRLPLRKGKRPSALHTGQQSATDDSDRASWYAHGICFMMGLSCSLCASRVVSLRRAQLVMVRPSSCIVAVQAHAPASPHTPESCSRPAATGAAMIWLTAMEASMTEYATVMWLEG